jgi:hypothetical protein
MKEFMLIIRNENDNFTKLSPVQQEQFLEKCQVYINKLKQENKLIEAQPLVREGTIISRHEGEWKEIPFNESKEVQVGYYHILAKDLEDAIKIAKANPEFEYGKSARIEVRPIKTKEVSTGFVYPSIQ